MCSLAGDGARASAAPTSSYATDKVVGTMAQPFYLSPTCLPTRKGAAARYFFPEWVFAPMVGAIHNGRLLRTQRVI